MVLDVIFLILVVIASIKGFSKGFTVALFSMVALFIGLAASLKLSAYAATKLSAATNSTSKWLPFISFLMVFLVVVLLVHLGAKLIQKSFELAMLGWLNRVGGVVLYLLLYSVFLSILLFYAIQLHLLSAQKMTDSIVFPFLEPLGPKIINWLGYLLPVFKNMFFQLENFFGKLPPSNGMH
jgi:membrane protein required for colicin V production